MASASSSLSVGPHEYVISDNIVSKENLLTNETPECEDNLCCFVCDVKAQGRHYALATCKTQTSRSRVIEKLGELVGERYMVVISEDDIICRTCANVINALDRLETEARAKKDIILDFLEKKYSLTAGELLQNNTNLKLCQLPRVTKKRNNTSISDEIAESASKKKHNTWMQCTQCKYTTERNSFMVYHTKHDIKQQLSSDKYDLQSPENLENANHECQIQNSTSNMDKETNKEEFVPKKSVYVATETITEENIPNLSIQSSSSLGSSTGDKRNTIAMIPCPRSFMIQNTLSSDDFAVMDKPGYMKVLPQIEATEDLSQSTFITQTSEISEAQIKIRRSSGKQLLTLTEDGNLEMVEVATWNAELDSNKTGLDINLPF